MTKYFIPLNLQLFTQTQTTLLNTAGNDLSPEMKTFYVKELIKHAQPNLVHDQFAMKKDIPAHGGKDIEFRRFTPLGKATTALVEGVTPVGNKLDVTAITSRVAQYGDFIQISDMLDVTAIDNVLVETTSILGSQAGRTLDTITREVITAGTNVMYAPKVAGGTETPVLLRTNLDATAKLTPKVVRKAAALLKRQNAPTIKGYYVAIIHPDISYDIQNDPEWQEAHKYASPEEIYEGELGRIGKVRFIESTEAKIILNAGQGGSAVYCTMVLGNQAYGTTSIDGLGLDFIVKQRGSAGTADPLNQRSSSGWKAAKTAERLVEQYMVRIEHSSELQDSAIAN